MHVVDTVRVEQRYIMALQEDGQDVEKRSIMRVLAAVRRVHVVRRLLEIMQTVLAVKQHVRTNHKTTVVIPVMHQVMRVHGHVLLDIHWMEVRLVQRQGQAIKAAAVVVS